MTDKQKAIIQYHESGIEKEEQSPLERLRFFCQLAMSGDDWVDAGHFFDSLALQVRDKVDVGPWSAGTTTDGRAYLESSDFTHDVRLYVDGDFAWPGDKKNYAQGLASQLNNAPVSAGPDLTRQTLDDVKAGIPARDAEIDAMRKEIKALKADQAQPTIKDSLTVDERAAFEAWASDDGEFPKAVERSGHGYKLMQTQTYWMAWQARAALARQEEKQ